MEKDGTGSAPLHVVHRARRSPKPVLNWRSREGIGLMICACGLRGAARGEPRRNRNGHGFLGRGVWDGTTEKTEDTEGRLGEAWVVGFLNHG
jgi:hypothetical protein